MNLPAAVLAAMAICNQHQVATRGPEQSGLTINGSGVWCGNLSGCSDIPHPQDVQYPFMNAYAWETPYQSKCKTIQNYVTKYEAWLDKKASDAQQAKDKAAKASEQPTLDKGIAALGQIKNLKQ